MYADRTARHHRIQPASLGASLLLSGVMVLGMVYVAPKIGTRDVDRPLQTYPVPPEPVPPPIPPEPQPHPRAPESHPIEHVVAPEPLLRTDTPLPTLDTTDLLPPQPPASARIGSALKSAQPAEPAPPPPVPPLVNAQPDPRYADDFQPPYPAAELRAGTEGRVTVRVLIGTDGRVKAVEPVQSVSDALFAATRRHALTHWRFTPATRGGVAVEQWKTMTVRFELQ